MELEKKEILVIKTIAENGPLTGFDLHTKRRTISNAHWETLRKKLTSDEYDLIYQVPDMGSRGKPFWVTTKGFEIALINGANTDKIKKSTFKLLGDSKDYHEIKRLCDYVKFIGPENSKNALKFLRGEKVVLSLDPEYNEGFYQFLELYPEVRNVVSNIMKQAKRVLRLE
jgi:hypothetical protein